VNDGPAANNDPTWILRLGPGDDERVGSWATGDGIEIAVKDCIDVVGLPTTAGSIAVADAAEPAAADADCLAGFRAADARLIGKTNLHELCFGASGVNPHYGTPPNPIDPRRIPGGSSSGSAVAVATGQVQVALGTDTTGSIRTPAACCGVVGLKPTYGVVPVVGVRPLAPSLDTVGVLARTVADVTVGATLLDDRIVAGEVTPSATVARLRFDDTDPTIDAAIDSALIDAGIEVTEIDLPGWAAAHEAAITVLFGEAILVNDDIWRHHQHTLGADLVERFLFAQTISAGELGEARARREPWRMELAEIFGAHGMLVLPSMLTYPARIGEQIVPPNPAAPAISLSGHPALSLPVPSGGLLPASLQLVAPDHHEARLLATAAVIEVAVAG
jgi:amidase